MTTAMRPEQELPRLWWCPTGWLSFLPLHAAGHYRGAAQPTPECATGRRAEAPLALPDRAVNSYTPTLRALIETRAREASASPSTSMLAVALAHTPGLPDLPAAILEVEQLRARIAATMVLADERATRPAILGALPTFTCLHFAGHGGQDPSDSASAALYCHDHQSSGPIRVTDIARLRPADARLAFLSACETAKGSAGLADEAIHIAGAVQLAGFVHVIATQWSISDSHAAQIADHVYDHLTVAIRPDQPGASLLDTSRTAAALHAATRELRRKLPQQPTLWASYLHIGP